MKLLLALLACCLIPPPSIAQVNDRIGASATAGNARIVTADLKHFLDAWDAMQSEESRQRREDILMSHYVDRGTPGLREFYNLRIGTARRLLEAIEGAPAYYESLRELVPVAGAIAEPVRKAYARLEALYPQAVFPDVYLLIGRLNAAGTVGETGMLIGFEMHGRRDDVPIDELNDWLKEVLRPPESLPYIIAHELIHFQQDLPESPTLLEASIIEGSADFIAELIAGDHVNQHVHAWALPREEMVWRRFRAHAGSSDFSGFLYSGAGEDRPAGWPADVGYFVGYRIAQAYYDRAGDKQQAIADILTCVDFDALLDESGYAARFRK